ncbi:hypothetical protein K9L16_03065 [Candidatus Pacearchaeota archaeon]|nr:hypothetical protein [Candidatus Pacearchaeota archaeon]
MNDNLEKTINCYVGQTKVAIEGEKARRYTDFIKFLYSPDSGVVVFANSQGTIIDAHRVTKNDREYLQGTKIKVDKREFELLVNDCVNSASFRDSASERLTGIEEKSKRKRWISNLKT